MAPIHTTVKTADGKLAPHPSYIEVAKPYIFENQIHSCLTKDGLAENRDDKVRLEGISWIDSVRKALHLPVRTYDTAAVYFHKFRLVHPESVGHLDAAAAALFAACKIEDTLKKSKEILCAAHNLRSPDRMTPDDPSLEPHSKSITGLERLMLEAAGFDFRNRYPQRLVLKLCRHHNLPTHVTKTAYNICIDLYRTFAPLKQTSPTLAIACVELACRLLDEPLPDSLSSSSFYKKLRTSRTEAMETLSDLLDLYINHRSSTLLGPSHPVDKFLNIRITLNQEASADNIPAHSIPKDKPRDKNGKGGGKRGPPQTNGVEKRKKHKQSPVSPTVNFLDEPRRSDAMEGVVRTGEREKGGERVEKEKEKEKGKPGLKEGTIRFMLSPRRAAEEKEVVDGFFRNVEVEEVVEVPIGRGRR